MAGVLIRQPVTVYNCLRRMSTGYLIENPKYSFLKELGLEKTNVGVFNGEWKANGAVSKGIVFALRIYWYLHNIECGYISKYKF